MKIQTYSYKKDTVYSIVPFFGKPKSVLVAFDAPREAHEYAKKQLKKAIKSESLIERAKRTKQKLGYWLIK